jgi:hypothetical protein
MIAPDFFHGCAMKLIRLMTLCMLGLATVPLTHASDFEAALSKETAQFTFRSDSSLIGWGGADLGLGLFFNEDDDFIGTFSLLQMRQASEENPLTFGVGVKAYLGRLDDPDANALGLAIGGQIRYTIPGTMPMAIYLEGHYAPEITSFADIDRILDYSFGFQIEALPQTIAFVGVRRFEFELDNGADYDADDSNIHIGVRLTF